MAGITRVFGIWFTKYYLLEILWYIFLLTGYPRLHHCTLLHVVWTNRSWNGYWDKLSLCIQSPLSQRLIKLFFFICIIFYWYWQEVRISAYNQWMPWWLWSVSFTFQNDVKYNSTVKIFPGLRSFLYIMFVFVAKGILNSHNFQIWS